jgi:hypothetical protein
VLREAQMTRPTFNNTEYAEFWLFWTWQYACRNPDYKKAHKKHKKLLENLRKLEAQKNEDRQYLQGISDNVEARLKWAQKKAADQRAAAGSANYSTAETKWLDFLGKCRVKFGWEPWKDPEDHRSSTVILDDIFCHKSKPNRVVAGFFPVIQDHPTWNLEDPNRFRFTVDLRKPLEQILAEVEYYYEREKLSRENPKKLKKRERDRLKDLHSKLIKYLVGRRKEDGFSERNELGRAIGLWLWDLKDQRPPKYSVREAIRNLDKKIDFGQIGFASVDSDKYGPDNEWDEKADPDRTYRTFSRYYKTTDECIKKMRILPIKK